MPVPTEHRIDDPQEQAVPEGEAPAKGETANADHGEEFVGRRGPHHLSVDDAKAATPKDQLVKNEQEQDTEQNSYLPMLEGRPIKSKLTVDQAEDKRRAGEEHRKPQRNKTEDGG